MSDRFDDWDDEMDEGFDDEPDEDFDDEPDEDFDDELDGDFDDELDEDLDDEDPEDYDDEDPEDDYDYDDPDYDDPEDDSDEDEHDAGDLDLDALDLDEEPDSDLTEIVEVSCPYCGEEGTIAIDPVGGDVQEYVEDCEVCCQPWSVRVILDTEGSASVEVDRLDDG